MYLPIHGIFVNISNIHCVCREIFITQMRHTGAVSFSISLLSHMRPLAISLPILSFSFSIYQFLSLLPSLSSAPLSLSLSLSLSFSQYAEFLRTLDAERERVYRSITERPRSRLLLLLEVRSRRAGFFPPCRPFVQFSLLFLATRRDAAQLDADSIPPPPRRPAQLAGRRLAADVRFIDELDVIRVNRCAIVVRR